MSGIKRDSAGIRRHLAALQQAPWLGASRAWWPNYVFHFTDIQNAVRILEGGKLLCRSSGEIARDIASSQVIDQTDHKWKDYVRLYFRPRTPTQFRNEGIREDLGELQAHCPVPVFLLFDAAELLCRSDCEFSNGNLASDGAHTGSDSNFLSTIPFERVYHDSYLNDPEKRNIIFHRHAEVLIPNELNLKSLKKIALRSEAELRSLRHLLTSRTWNSISKRTSIIRQLFFRRWTFVEAAELSASQIKFRFNSSLSLQQFRARLEIHSSTQDLFWKDDTYSARKDLTITIRQFTEPVPYSAQLTLNGNLAFCDSYIPDEIQF